MAEAHIESGWAPRETRVDELESAVRACCEPIFDRPLKDISFGQILLRLFQTSRRFNVEVQPQLVLLQKTLLNIEGLGRQLDPDLDLWKTAKPYLERWMAEQVGVQRHVERLKAEAPRYTHIIPQLPRLLHQRADAPGRAARTGQRAAAWRWWSNSAAPTACWPSSSYFAGALGLGLAGDPAVPALYAAAVNAGIRQPRPAHAGLLGRALRARLHAVGPGRGAAGSCASLSRAVAAGAATLIPGCGAAYELAYLVRGRLGRYRDRFFAGRGGDGARDGGAVGGRVVRGRFFRLRAGAGRSTLIYERAFLCALPRAMWPQVAARWAQLLPPGGLLAGFFFFDDAPKGPPFGISRDELDALAECRISSASRTPRSRFHSRVCRQGALDGVAAQRETRS